MLQTSQAVKRLVPKHVLRTPDVEKTRSLLPIILEEAAVLDAIINNLVVVISGDTGSGKSTQVPQFLFEAGFGNSDAFPGIVGVTQPRKMAAISIARRVRFEMEGDENSTKTVGYQTKECTSLSTECSVKVMTDGILLREVEDDLLLSKYSVVVLDEVHERSVNTDILLTLLSKTALLRQRLSQSTAVKPFRLVLMSATVDWQPFLDSFFRIPVPVLRIAGNSFDVVEHFARATKEDYVAEALLLVKKIHRELPPGDILVFLPGKSDILRLAGLLKTEAADPAENLAILPFHSSLPLASQHDVFAPARSASRKCILATNIAETSITIPNVKYVVDSGRVKCRHFDSGLRTYYHAVEWASKASARQRMGRAGRTCNGHCYRLYSSAVFEANFPESPMPEICRTSIEDLVLLLKKLKIDKVEHFPLPNMPSPAHFESAMDLLTSLGALLPASRRISPIGAFLGKFQLHPCHAKLIYTAMQTSDARTVYLAACLAAILGTDKVFKAYTCGSKTGSSELFPLLKAFMYHFDAEHDQSLSEAFKDTDIILRQILKTLRLEFRLAVTESHDMPGSKELAFLRKALEACLPLNICMLASSAGSSGAKSDASYVRLCDNSLVHLHHTSPFIKHPPLRICYIEAYTVEAKTFVKYITDCAKSGT